METVGVKLQLPPAMPGHALSFSHVSRVVSFVGLGLWLGLAIQASRVYLRGVSMHTATGEASRVYSISLSF